MGYGTHAGVCKTNHFHLRLVILGLNLETETFCLLIKQNLGLNFESEIETFVSWSQF
jgi:hypothetical protein